LTLSLIKFLWEIEKMEAKNVKMILQLLIEFFLDYEGGEIEYQLINKTKKLQKCL